MRERTRRWPRFAAFLAALAVFLVAALVLFDTLKPLPVAANFTRVGGVTRVETAVEAARFWVTRPDLVYLTPAAASRQVMLRAAACAMADDAPLLFSSRSPKRQRKVDALIERWRDSQNSLRRPDVITVESMSDCTPRPGASHAKGLRALTEKRAVHTRP